MARASAGFQSSAMVVALLTFGACAEQIKTAKPLCAIDSTVGTERPARDRQFPSSYWFTLLLSGYGSSGVVSRPARDCSGRGVTVVSEGCGNDRALDAVPIDHLTEKDLLVADAGEATRLVWAMTDRIADGQVQGPVGLVDITERGLVVRALGVLRAYPERATLRVTRLGTGTLLVAEGERCGDRASSEGCARAIRFLLLSGDRFLPVPVSDARGVCLGPAFVALTARGTEPVSSDRYRLETSVSFGADEVTFREQLTIAATKAGAGEFIRQVRSDRRLGLHDGHLVASGPALLSRWLVQSGRALRPASGAADSP